MFILRSAFAGWKIESKKEDRPLLDMQDVRTACQQACPTDAIVFGNINDSKSAVVKERVDNEHRLYHVLEELHVLPNISYLAKVRNPEAEAKDKTERIFVKCRPRPMLKVINRLWLY